MGNHLFGKNWRTGKSFRMFLFGILLLGVIQLFHGNAHAVDLSEIKIIPLDSALQHAVPAIQVAPPTQNNAADVATRIQQAISRIRASKASQGKATGARNQSQRPQIPIGNAAVKADLARSKRNKTVPAAFHAALKNQPIQAAAAQAIPGKVNLRHGRTVRSIHAHPGKALQKSAPLTSGKSRHMADQETVLAFIKQYRSVFGLKNPDGELHPGRQSADKTGNRFLRLGQTYQNIPVWGAELIAQLNANGDLLSVNGAYLATPVRLDTTPVVTDTEAVELAIQADPGGITEAMLSSQQLVIYPGDFVSPRLAWKMEFNQSLQTIWVVLVDAETGEILVRFNRVPTINAPGSGIDLLNINRQLDVWQQAGTYYMVNTAKTMFDPTSNPPSPTTTSGAIIITDARNQPTDNPVQYDVTSTSANSGWLPDAVSAAYGLSATYDYFLNRHGRNSLDDQGGNISAVVRYQQNHANAFFMHNTQTMYFGDAEPYAASLDVVAHELSHGVTFNSANLKYVDQSGALNEAFSDIFGEMTEASATGSTDWLTGSALSSPLRNHADPSSINSPFGMPYPSKMSEYVDTTLDNGGVHINSSIINHAFYLLAQGMNGAIGQPDAEDIFYRALTIKLTPLSDFVDMRIACIEAANELFGTGSTQAQKTAEAFDAVEIFDVPQNPLPSPIPPVAGPDSVVFIFYSTLYNDYFIGRREAALNDPASGSFLSSKPVAPTKPAVSGDGEIAVFVNASHDICFIRTDGSLPEICLGYPGQTHSVAMTPDGNQFGFVNLDSYGSAKNEILLVDLATKTERTLKLTSLAMDDIARDIIIKADAIDFTSDGRYLLSDALNLVQFGDGSTQVLWSIYALDLTTDSTLVVVPPIKDRDTGYPSVAQTSDRFLTFDFLDASSGTNIVITRDLYTPSLGIVGFTNDYSFPGYTGDDAAIVYSDSAPVPTLFSLFRQPLSADHITPSGARSLWKTDGAGGVVYRRGTYTGTVTVDLEVTQASTPATITGGASFYYDITTTNKSASPATGVTLTDTLPTTASFQSFTAPSGATCSYQGGQVTCNLGNIGAGQSASVQIHVTPNSPGLITNAVSVAANETDSDLSNNTAFADTTVITILDNDSDGIPDSIDPDDDNDGMPDTYELANLFNPLNASDAATDADGDGYSNLSEYRAGSDPRDPASVPSYVPMPWLPLLLE